MKAKTFTYSSFYLVSVGFVQVIANSNLYRYIFLQIFVLKSVYDQANYSKRLCFCTLCLHFYEKLRFNKGSSRKQLFAAQKSQKKRQKLNIGKRLEKKLHTIISIFKWILNSWEFCLSNKTWNLFKGLYLKYSFYDNLVANISWAYLISFKLRYNHFGATSCKQKRIPIKLNVTPISRNTQMVNSDVEIQCQEVIFWELAYFNKFLKGMNNH